MMDSDFLLVRIEDDLIHKVEEVHISTRNSSLGVSFFKQKLNSNCKEKYISLVYLDNQTATSHCAAIPNDFESSNDDCGQLIGAQVCDAVTSPDYQRRGLFKRINFEIESISTQEPIDFLFRFPSQINYNRVLNDFGFTHTESFKSFEFKFKFSPPFMKILEKFKMKKSIRIYCKFMSLVSLSRKKVFDSSLKEQGFYHVPHNEEYFNYKTFNENYKVSAFGDSYWIKHGDGLIVGDFKIKSEKNFLRKLKWFCFFFGIHKVRFYVSEESREFKWLSKYQEHGEGIPICLKNTGNRDLDLNKIKFTYAELDTF